MTLNEFIAKCVEAAVLGGPFLLIVVGAWITVAYDTQSTLHWAGLVVAAVGISLVVCLVLLR